MITTNDEPATELRPGWAIPPSRHLVEELEFRGLSWAELADEMGYSEQSVTTVLRGRAPITEQFAEALERTLSIDATLWLQLQASYDESLSRLAAEPGMAEDIALLDDIPWRECLKRGWIQKRGTKIERVLELRTHYDVDALCDVKMVHDTAFRVTAGTKASPWAVAAWLQQGEWQAIERRILLGPKQMPEFDRDLFKQIINEIRPLTRAPHFWPKLKSLCASGGVHLECVPQLKKSGANGATKWLDDARPLIVLSSVRKRADVFWFSFFHEVAHVLSGDHQATFIDLDDVSQDDEIEQSADRFAADFLIPSKHYDGFVSAGRFNRHTISKFANAEMIHPGLVVGRLRRDRRIQQNQLSDLLKRVDESQFEL